VSEPPPAAGDLERDVFIDDQLGQPKIYRITGPDRLCVPVSKDGSAIENPLVDLACFGVKRAKGQPKHVPVTGIQTQDEFGAWQIRSSGEVDLCVPAESAP
jgi:hypothetical protein